MMFFPTSYKTELFLPRGRNTSLPFNEEDFTDLFVSGKLTNGETAGYGYGWKINSLGGEKVIFHDGSTSGFNNVYIRIPSRKLNVIFLTNRNDFNLVGLTEMADKFKGIVKNPQILEHDT